MPGYVINVARINPIQHIFRTAEDSISDFNEALMLVRRLETSFPQTLFHITISFVEKIGKQVWDNQSELTAEDSSFILRDGGNAYRMKLHNREYILEHAGVFTDGKLDDFGAVEFSMIDDEAKKECRRIEKALLTAMGVL